MAECYTTVLSIAGSDSIGGAGIQADIKTCSAHGVYAMTAITAVTAQNTYKVAAIEELSPEFVRQQLETIFADVRPDAIKIGMLPDVEVAHEVALFLKKNATDIPIVVDPVMVATAGDALAKMGVADVIINEFVPIAALLTPNLPEAAVIALKTGLTDFEDLSAEDLAFNLQERLGCNILLKGGHSEDNDGELEDILMMTDDVCYSFTHEKIDTLNTHGTGCSLSSAIACGLAKGLSLPDACEQAIDWLQNAIAAGAVYEFGRGHGPVNFTVSQCGMRKGE